MNKLPKILCLTTLGLLLLAMLQGATDWPKLRPLRGAYVSAEWPRCSLDSLLSGEWQRGVDAYVKEHHGFRPWGIRTYNQYIWSAYHRSPNPGCVEVGKNDYLFEPFFVDEYYTGCSHHYYPSEQTALTRFQRTSERLAKVQQILEEQGVHLFVALLPGKERIYPQMLPPRDGISEAERAGHLRAVECYPALFDSLGVRYVDVCHWFDRLNGHVPYRLFSQTGTHWSLIATTYAFDSMMRYMQTFGPPIRRVSLGAPYRDNARESDKDLDLLLNKLFTIPVERNQYVDVALADADTAKHPSLIDIGDSFFWNILYSFPMQDLFSDLRYWYYFSTIYYDPDHDQVGGVDLVDELLSADYVMLSYCTVQLYKLGNGFVERALMELCYDPEEYQPVLDRLASDMADGRSVDERLADDLEQLFPDLQGMPSRRCSRLRATK